jgi:beta-alanine--pyruvate transaminase
VVLRRRPQPPEIADAIAAQARELDYAPAFQFGHPKAFELATRIRALMPPGLDKVFFVNSGSEAADTSLKIARAYWRQQGQPGKTRLIGRAKGYHGVNFGGISVGGIGPNRKLFGHPGDRPPVPHPVAGKPVQPRSAGARRAPGRRA